MPNAYRDPRVPPPGLDGDPANPDLHNARSSGPTRSNTPLQKALYSASGWPITILYVGASSVASLMAANVLGVAPGLILIAVLFCMMLVVSVSREIKSVHHLVNSQRDELLARIDQLIQVLVAADITVPRATEKGKER